MERAKLNSPNTFCWIELACHNLPTAKKFYGSVLGWKFKDSKSNGGVYSHINLGQKGFVGGVYEFALPEDEAPKKKGKKQEMQVPAFWGSYIATKNLAAATKKAKTLGGTIIADQMDLGDAGTISVIQDPVGAMFGLWQGKKQNGFGPDREEMGACAWNELMTYDLKKSVDFYSKLFGWKTTKAKFHGNDYVTFTLNNQRVGGMMSLTDFKFKDMPPHWLTYFNVKDCDKSTKTAKEQGAKVLFSPTTVKGAGRMSIVTDAEGAVFALMHYDPKK